MLIIPLTMPPYAIMPLLIISLTTIMLDATLHYAMLLAIMLPFITLCHLLPSMCMVICTHAVKFKFLTGGKWFSFLDRHLEILPSSRSTIVSMIGIWWSAVELLVVRCPWCFTSWFLIFFYIFCFALPSIQFTYLPYNLKVSNIHIQYTYYFY